MSITVEYKDGSRRIVCPHPSFFVIDKREVATKKLNRDSILLERIKNLTSATGIVYKFTYVLNEKTTLEYENLKNKPETKSIITPETYHRWRQKRKKLMKELNAKAARKQPFTIFVSNKPKSKLRNAA